ncbi:MAG: methyltransferase domain-containing protein, partial [Myxococcales bacterium]
MVPLFKETNFALVGNLGRPRNAVLIGVGLAETASHLHALGTKVVALEADPDLLDRATDLASEAHPVDLASPNPFAILADRRFDLIAVEGAQLIADLPRFFARAAEHLVDGGHVVVCSQSGRLEVREALEQAGLDVLRYDLNPRVFRSKLPSGATKAVDDLRITHTVSFRATYALLRHLERLIALGQPDLLAAEHIYVARV